MMRQSKILLVVPAMQERKKTKIDVIGAIAGLQYFGLHDIVNFISAFFLVFIFTPQARVIEKTV
jgi:hypothetical protein